MRVCLSRNLREMAAGLVLDDTPMDPLGKKVVPPTKSIEITRNKEDGEESVRIPIPKAKPDEYSKVRKTKRPAVKPPRRITDYKAKWKGQGSRDVRKDYQRQYRQENGNGYTKKIKTSYSEYVVNNHEAKQLKSE